MKSADAGHEQRIDNWHAFKYALQDQFKPVNSVKTARDKLVKLQQRKSVQEYAAQFRSLVLEIPGISEDEKLDRFIRGLKENTRMEVECKEPNNLNDAIKIADRYDSIAFKYQKNRMDYPKKWNSPVKDLGPAPMELDAKRPNRWQERKSI